MFPLSVCVPSHCRYSIERVFRPRKLDRAHPRELLECAFDIITPVTNSLLPDAETIYTISEIVQEFPALQVTTTCESVCVSDDAASRRAGAAAAAAAAPSQNSAFTAGCIIVR